MPASLWRFLALLLLTGCLCQTKPGAWMRIDLWSQEPEVEASVSAIPPLPASRRIGPLGLDEVRDLSRLSFTPPGKHSANQGRILEQRVGSRLRWRLRLGNEPYLSFTPLGALDGECPCIYRVAVREKTGDVRELGRIPLERLGNPAPHRTRIELAPYAGQPLELLLEVNSRPWLSAPAAHCTALWGSPAIYMRTRPVSPPSSDRPNVLLLTLDTLRADALGVYGRRPSVTPTLDRLARESEVWLEAFSTSNTTNPSHVSIMTGLYGKNHGVHSMTTPLPDSRITLAELLAENGYRTLAIISVRHLADATSGLGQGFDRIEESTGQFAAELVVEMAMDWLASTQPPFFVWLHFFDPHTPHTPPLPYAAGLRPSKPWGLGKVARWISFRPIGLRSYPKPGSSAHPDLYLGEVAYLDRQLDRLLDFLHSHRLLEDSLLAVVGDHGENLGERGMFPGHHGLWDSTTHVPMMLRRPGTRPRADRIEGLVQTIDLFPTLLAAAGLPVPPQDGIDLAQLADTTQPGRRAIFSEQDHRLGASIRTRTHRYFVSLGDSEVPAGNFLYDLEADPGETVDAASSQPHKTRELSQRLERWLAEVRSGLEEAHPMEIDEELRQQLRALGYLE